MRILPASWSPKIKNAFNLRKKEFHYRLAADPLTSEIKVRTMKDGSTVFARYSEKLGTPYASDVFVFRPNMSIEAKTYQYIRETEAKDSKPIGEIIRREFFKNNSYVPYKTATKAAWK